ncbi:MAG: threonine ammonia-lyase [Geodermatophilaceae bacterium]|nr:threonine ammonia-lyase [Geodermatophilaceae bacterium]
MGLRVDVEEVLQARSVLAGIIRYTPLEHCRVLEERTGSPVYLKCENLQRTGSFKIRGAYVRISRLSAAERARGVVAASAGNHAQGVALAAGMLGARSTVFMPTRAPLPKIAATTSYGAEVILTGDTIADAMIAAIEYAHRTGAIFIHPFDHPDIIAGQGTVGLEILEQCPEVRTVLVCTGGGGLVSGMAAAIKGSRPDVRVVAVQAEGAASFPPSLAAGEPVALDVMATMADGIAVPTPGPVTFEHVRDLVDEVTTVSEEALSRALLLCLERAKLVVEPAGAAAVAAIMEEPKRFDGPIVAVLSGGNIDPLLLLRVMQHGMIAAGRYLSLRMHVPDRPGSLAVLLTLLADLGANVLDVEHSRTSARLHLGEVGIALSLETRGIEHCERVLAELRAAGYVSALD